MRSITHQIFIVLTTLILLPTSARAQLTWNLYGDMNGVASTLDGQHPSFNLGGVDFFITSDITDNIRLLSENVLEIDPATGEAGFDLERIYIEYIFSQKLSLRFGRTHTALGYYGTAFHHALLFQLTQARPKVFSFEDQGGILPAHMIGVEAFGQAELGDLGAINYMFYVGNGRGSSTTDVLSVADKNLFKALGARIGMEFYEIEGLQIGISGYLDRIPPGGNLSIELTEVMSGAYLLYDAHPIHFLSEWFLVQHFGHQSSNVINNTNRTQLFGGYAQTGYTIGEFTPYAKWNYFNRDSNDLFFNNVDAASTLPLGESLNEFGLGCRYRLAPSAVLKIEGLYGLATPYQSTTIHNFSGAVQAAFGF